MNSIIGICHRYFDMDINKLIDKNLIFSPFNSRSFNEVYILRS